VVSPDIEYFEKLGLSIEENSVFTAISEAVEKLNEKLPMHKRISGIEVRTTEFPKTSTRKIKRFEVRKEMEALWRN
jgi:long-chain acyl-CoA synthetase